MKRILLVKTSSLGDVIHNLPVVNDILQHHADAQIDWLVDESFADIPRLHPRVNQVFTVAFRRWKKAIFSPKLWIKTWAEINTFKKNIRQNQYDAIIDTQGLLKSALAMRYASGVKHGYDKQSIREPIASLFYDKTYNISYQQHAVTRNRALCAMSLGDAAPTNAPDYGIAAAKPNLELPQNFVIGLHGTSRDSKLWPVEHWVNLGKQLAQQNMSLVLPWASDAEQTRANTIKNQLLNGFVMPKMRIAEVASVIAEAQAAVGVDTGLSHLAAALNIPTIAIYTDTNPQLTGVMGGAFKPAVNLGGIAQTPSVVQVIESLKKFTTSS